VWPLLRRKLSEASIKCGMRICNRGRAMWLVNWGCRVRERARKKKPFVPQGKGKVGRGTGRRSFVVRHPNFSLPLLNTTFYYSTCNAATT